MNPVKAMFDAVDVAFPAGTKALGFLVTLTLAPDDTARTDGLVVAEGTRAAPAPLETVVPLDAREALFDDVPPGTYWGTIALVDMDKNPLAPAIADGAPMIIVDATPVSFPVPTTLSLTRP